MTKGEIAGIIATALGTVLTIWLIPWFIKRNDERKELKMTIAKAGLGIMPPTWMGRIRKLKCPKLDARTLLLMFLFGVWLGFILDLIIE